MPKARILVVDEAKSSRELLKLHLGNAGYEVETAEDAIHAGKRLLQDPPHLLITDVHMPYMSGVELVAALRAEDRLADLPVIFIGRKEDRAAEDRRLRAAAWLTKPVSVDRLLEIVALHAPLQ